MPKTEPAESEDNILARRRREAEAIYGSDQEVGGQTAESWEELFAESEFYTITKMTEGVRNPNRVNIFLDGCFAFSLDIAQVVDLGIKVRQKIDQEKYQELKAASEFGKLYQRTLEWALTRPHSIREAKDYLKRRKYKRTQLNRQREREQKLPFPEIKDETIELVIRRLIEKGYLDDLKFAKFFVENRNIRRGVSQRKLRLDLMRKGVSEENINLALEEVERPEDEELKKAIRKKRAKYDDFRLVGYLVRQGFDYVKAKEAVAKYDPDRDEE